VCTWQQDLEDLLPLLDTLNRRTADVADPDSIEAAMFQSCQSKAVQLAQLIFHTVLDKYQEPKEATTIDENERGDYSEQQREMAWVQQAQASIARLAELNFILIVAGVSSNQIHESVQHDLDDTIQRYVKYQRSVLRLRAKPHIARLVEYRKEQSNDKNKNKNSANGGLFLDGKVKIHHDESDSEDEDEEEKAVYEQHHAPVLTHILGQSAALIHPLLVWQTQLPPRPCENFVVESIRKMCQETIQVLDEQTQVLIKSVSDWFWEDHPIEEYLSQAVEIDDPNSAKNIMNRTQLGLLDGLVEEMRFSCHAQAHYVALVASSSDDGEERTTDGSATTPTAPLAQTLEKELLPEWTWKYASLERFLAVRQWQSALAVCQPVQIVIGMPIRVPSVVEDAQFLSTRALERSATTRSVQAMGTVAHAVSHDIWSTDSGVTGSVYQALVEQRGCWSAPTKEHQEVHTVNQSSSKQKLDFALALMDALDDDMVQAAVAKKPGVVSSPGRHPSAPSSGGFLGLSLGDNEAVLQMQIDVRFCVMNGAHASAAACRALVEYLDSLLKSDDALDTRGGRSTSMIELAREELFRYAGDYDTFLKGQIRSSVVEFAGGTHNPRSRLVLDRIYGFFANENYAIDAKEIKKLEDDDRLAKELDGRFHSSMFVNQISQKGESHVIHMIGEELEESLTQIVTDALFVSERKVTDWGALLFWKEIRRLQGLVTQALTSDHADEPPVFAWARLSQIATVLQLESPSEWLIYRTSASVLTNDELEQTMSLRADFSVDAIRTVLSNMSAL